MWIDNKARAIIVETQEHSIHWIDW